MSDHGQDEQRKENIDIISGWVQSEVYKKLNGSWSMITRATSMLKDSDIAKHASHIHNNYGAFSDRQNP